MRSQFLAAAAVLILAGCGSGPTHAATSPSSRASTTTSASPPAAQGALFAVATGIPGLSLVATGAQPAQATVKIVDASGRVYAQAAFTAPPAPMIGNAAPLLQSPVRTVAGAVFYADSAGAIHKLTADGSTSVVATFPLSNSQQELSYAVSPDGAHLIATVLSTPPLHNPPPQSLSDPLFQAGGHWTLKLEYADAGGVTATTLQKDLGTAFPSPTQIVGWDANGPLATLSTAIGAQQATPSARFYGSPLIHLAKDGTHLPALGGVGCTPVDELADGTVICDSDSTHLSVRNPAGDVRWQAALPTDNYYYGLWLSPDANSVAAQDIVITPAGVASAARLSSTKQVQVIALGWLDANTIMEANPSTGQLSLYEARSMVKVRDLGLSGIFEGLL